MANEELMSYVRDERAKGVTDEAIRAELVAKGWKDDVVKEVLPLQMGESVSAPSPAATGRHMIDYERSALKTLLVGFAFFLVSSALLYRFGAGRDFENAIVFHAFSLTHIVNGFAAGFLFFALWKISRGIFYRIILSVCALVVALFALLSFMHFESLATGLKFFEIMERTVLHDDYMPLIIYFLLLPLQVVAFALLAVTLFILKIFRKRRGVILSIRTSETTLGVFFIMALLALGDLYLVLNGMHF